MDINLKSHFLQKVEVFRLPRYKELPNVGLYLEQVTKYINGLLVPLGCGELTSSMISNYVKKKIIDSPVKKQYDADRIAYLIVVGVTKNILSMEQLAIMFKKQRGAYDTETAYNYFCDEFENVLKYICGSQNSLDRIGENNSELKTLFRNAIIASSHAIFLNSSFDILEKDDV